jgi:hypothetical protein
VDAGVDDEIGLFRRVHLVIGQSAINVGIARRAEVEEAHA